MFGDLPEMSGHNPTPGQYVVRFLDDYGPVKLALSPGGCNPAPGAVRGSWGLHVHQVSSLLRGNVRNVDKSHGTELSTLMTWTCPVAEVGFRIRFIRSKRSCFFIEPVFYGSVY